jgi:hypothetical protein
MKKLLAVLLVALSSVCYAEQGDLGVSISGISAHFSEGGNSKKNAYNWGAGVSYEVVDRLFVFAAENRNSKWQDSVKYGAGYRFFQSDNFSATVRVQNATGYGYAGKNGTWIDQDQQSVQLAGCYKLSVGDGIEGKKRNPSLCATVPLYWTNNGNSSGGVDSVLFYIQIPVTNLLN